MPMRDNRLTERMCAVVRATVRGAGATRLLVACSGGGDSVCLAHAVIAVARQGGWQIALGHVRHGVRADDGDDAALVEQLARALDVPVFVRTYASASLAANETALRQARYTALAAMATEFCADAVLTGHTRDDQAETVLLRLLRGSGMDGLAAMAPDALFPVSTSARLRVLRPLLDVRRTETRAYCAAHTLAYRDDPTNSDPAYRRNWVRHAVLPLLAERYPAVADTLARTADLMREDADYLRALTEGAIDRCTVPSPFPAVTILDRATLAAESIALQRRVLRAIIARYSPDVPRANRLEIVRRAMSDGATTHPQAIGSIAFWPAYGVITVGSEQDVIATVRHRALQRHPLVHYDRSVPFTGNHVFAVADSLALSGKAQFHFALMMVSATGAGEPPTGARYLRLPPAATATLALRNRLPGDRFHAAGGSGSRKLQDYLTDNGVPAPLRDELPLLVCGDDGDEIVAVIGYDSAAAFSATAATATHVLALRTAPVP